MKSVGRAISPLSTEQAFAQVLALIRPQLANVEARLHESLQSDSEPVQTMVSHLSRFGGKRLRPALVLLAARSMGRSTDEHITLGVIVELIHLATLLHDDVLDHASTRRKLPTLNSEHGNRLPILLGDVVYAQAFTLSNGLEDRTASRYLAGTTTRLCVGEIEQNFSRGRLDLSESEYFRIIEYKTASLYEASGYLGAHYAGAPEKHARALGDFGRDLGIAFQITDDCLDLVGDERRVGKSLGTDLDERKLTLPLIHLVGRLQGADLEALCRILDDPQLKDRRAALQSRFDLTADLAHAQDVAAQSVLRARAHLEKLPHSDAREALSAVTRCVLARDL